MFAKSRSKSLSRFDVLLCLGGIIGIGFVIASLSGGISRASSRSNVNFVGLGSDLVDLLFLLISVGNRGDGRGFSSGDPGGDDTLLSMCVFDRIGPCPSDSPGLARPGRRRGDAWPVVCCSQLHKELLEECGVSGRGGRFVIRCKSSLSLTTMIGCGILFVDPFDSHSLLLCRLKPSTLSEGVGLPLPSVNFRLASSSLSQKRCSSEFCRRCGMSRRMLRFDRASILKRELMRKDEELGTRL
jgi:hypothetical protein